MSEFERWKLEPTQISPDAVTIKITWEHGPIEFVPETGKFIQYPLSPDFDAERDYKHKKAEQQP